MSPEPGNRRPSDFVVESHPSRIERALVGRVCAPLLRLVPEGVSPNAITLANHALCWGVALLAMAAPTLPRPRYSLALLLVAAGLFATMVGDCLDGMQARRTGRTSRLGEMLDHWLDAIAAPLVTVGSVSALQMDPWAVVAVHVTAMMVYQAQLVLYHHSGRFVHPPTSGVDGQFLLALVYVGMAAVFFFLPRQSRPVDMLLAVLAGVALVTQLRLNAFYWRRLGRLALRTLPFALACGALGGLYLAGLMSRSAFLLTTTFVSFRVSGSYVLFTLVGRRYGGLDWGIPAGIAAIAVAALTAAPLEVGRYTVPALMRPLPLGGYLVRPETYVATIPYLFCLYLAGRNLIDLARHFSALRPVPEDEIRPV